MPSFEKKSLLLVAISGVWLLFTLEYLGVFNPSQHDAQFSHLNQTLWVFLGSTLAVNFFLFALQMQRELKADQSQLSAVFKILAWNTLITTACLVLQSPWDGKPDILQVPLSLNTIPTLLSIIGYWICFPGTKDSQAQAESPTLKQSTSVLVRLASFPIMIAVLASDFSRICSPFAEPYWIESGTLGFALLFLSVFFPKWLHYVTSGCLLADSNQAKPLAYLITRLGLADISRIHLLNTGHRLMGAFALGGLGTKETILISDRLLDDLDTNEALAIILHEQGHVIGHHGAKRIMTSICFFASSVFAVGALPPLLAGQGSSMLAIQCLIGLCCFSISLVGWSWLAQQLEFAADLTAIELMDSHSSLFVSPQCLAAAILKLSGRFGCRSTLSHPSAFQRSQRLRRHGASRDGRVKELAKINFRVRVFLGVLGVVPSLLAFLSFSM